MNHHGSDCGFSALSSLSLWSPLVLEVADAFESLSLLGDSQRFLINHTIIIATIIKNTRNTNPTNTPTIMCSGSGVGAWVVVGIPVKQNAKCQILVKQHDQILVSSG